MNNNPFFSIVMANYNSGSYIEKAILSVLSQSCNDFELIIVDGGSTDNSVDIIRKYENRLAWWVSEPDKGQSDAFNKGFSHAKGQFFTWLNADDMMVPGALEAIKKYSKTHPKRDWLTVNTVYIDKNDTVLNCGWLTHYSHCILSHCSLTDIGPSSFFRARLFNEVGQFDIDNHYSMDADLWIRFVKSGYRYYRIPIEGWAFRLHELSKTSASVTGEASEGQKLARKRYLDVNHFEERWVNLVIQKMKRVITCFPKHYYLNKKYVGKSFKNCGSFE